MLTIFLMAMGAQAHKLNILALADGNTLSVNSYFVDGTPCMNCSFKITDHAGVVFAEGKLAKDGTFSKTGNLPDKLDVVVDAGLGHRAEQEVDVKGSSDSDSIDDTSSAQSADNGEIRKIVRQELNRQTVEIMAAIDKSHSNADKIIAGIGYLLGIFGLMALFRKK